MHVLLFIIICISATLSTNAEGKLKCIPPCLYYATDQSVSRFAVSSKTGSKKTGTNEEVLRTDDVVSSLEVDPINLQLYVVSGFFTIYQANLNNTKKIKLPPHPAGMIQSLAFDWSSNNLYWVDLSTKTVEVYNVKNNYRKVLIQLQDDEEPLALCVNPVEGYIFWSSKAKQMKIERSNLAGHERIVIVESTIRLPHDLTINYENKRLLWIDAHHDVIESVNFDGSDRRFVYKLKVRPVGGQYSLAYYSKKKFAYVSDYHSLYNIRNTSRLSSRREFIFTKGSGMKVRQIKMLTDINYKTSAPCLSDKNNCSHICFKKYNTEFECACPTGMKMLFNLTQTCVEVERDFEIYFVDKGLKTVNHLIRYVDQDGFTLSPLPVPSHVKLESPTALDYDMYEKFIYWTDVLNGKVYRMKENGAEFSTVLSLNGTMNIAVDKIRRILYWFGEHSLMMSTLDGGHTKSFHEITITMPEDIALYEEMGWIYFSDIATELIYRINNDATAMIQSDFSVYAIGIAIDKIENRIYWCSGLSNDISFSGLDLKSNYVLIKSKQNLGYPFSISILGDNLFWSDVETNSIYIANKRTNGTVKYVTGGVNHPQDIHVYHKKPQIEYRKKYMFGILLSKKKRPKCFAKTKACTNFVSKNKTPEPPPCPTGYIQTNYSSTCASCKYSYGDLKRCPCTNWMTCAQRFHGYEHGCNQHPITYFKLRECSQAVKPGYCKFATKSMCTNGTNCTSDVDCDGPDKCCQTKCGMKCSKAVERPNIPCTVNNGGCSHFCVGDSNSYKCLCPDGMMLSENNKTCVNGQSKICLLPKNRGSCFYQYRVFWYYDTEDQKCDWAIGCQKGGNANYFPDEKLCKRMCEFSSTGPATTAVTTTVTKNPSEPFLYYSNGDSILRMKLIDDVKDMRKSAKKIVTPRSNIVSLDVDHMTKQMFIGGDLHGSINRTSLDGSNNTVLFSYAIGEPAKLAFDWASNNLYWIDSLKKTIEVSDIKNRYHKVLFQFVGSDEPQGLAVCSVDGYLFWSVEGNLPRIERSSLSGADREVLVNSNIIRPDDLTIDYEKKRLLWIDSSKNVIESVDFKGKDRQFMFKLTKRYSYNHPYSLAYHTTKKMAYVSDVFSLYSIRNTSTTNSKKKTIISERSGTFLVQLRILGSYTNNASVPCLSTKNNCSHMCFKKSGSEFECACPTGMIISPKQLQTCVQAERDFEIYFADKGLKTVNHLIKYVDQDGFNLTPLPVPSNRTLESPSALDYDPYEEFIYWTDTEAKKIYRMKGDGQNFSVIRSPVTSLGIAIDKITKILYWFDTDHSDRVTLMMSTSDGKQAKSLYYNNIGKTQDITLYEEKGLIFFTDDGHLTRLNTDGSNLLQSPFSRVTDVAVDKLENKLYWTDRIYYTLNFGELDFTNHRSILASGGHAMGLFVHPYSIAIMGDLILWSDVRRKSIFSANKLTGGNVKYIVGGLRNPQDLHVYRDHVKRDTVDHRRIYKFSYIKEDPNSVERNSEKCFITNKTCHDYISQHGITDPEPCPPGYVDNGRVYSTCTVCGSFDRRNDCPCDNWMTCAYKNYGIAQDCGTIAPYTFFKVRECIQVVRPGYCMSNTTMTCPSDVSNCTADSDCPFYHKCCKTSCGQKCTRSTIEPDTPCTIKNGGCSHFCVGDSNSYKCLCPDGMMLSENNKTCVQGQNSVCHTKEPKRCFSFNTRWYFDRDDKICEKKWFVCIRSSSKNNFNTKEQCQKICEVSPATSRPTTKETTAFPSKITKTPTTPPVSTTTTTLPGSTTTTPPGSTTTTKETTTFPDKITKTPTTTPVSTTTTPPGSTTTTKETTTFPDKKTKTPTTPPGLTTTTKETTTFPDKITKTPTTPPGSTTATPPGSTPTTTLKTSEETIGTHTTKQPTDTSTTVSDCQCLHGGTCLHVISLPFCDCEAPWYGDKCQIKAGENHVKPKFRKVGSVKLTVQFFKKKFAAIFSLFCSDTNACIFVVLVSQQRQRRSISSNMTFTEDDILINAFQETNDSVSFELVIRQPPSGDGDVKVLSEKSLEEGLKKYGNNISEYIQFQPLKVQRSDNENENGSNAIVIGVVTLAVILVLMIFIITIVYVKKRRQEKFDVPTVRFENRVYDDLYPEEKGHICNENKTEAMSNPGYVSADELCTGGKEESNADTKKQPVYEFVEANYGDPFNVEPK